jgi:exonuclease III
MPLNDGRWHQLTMTFDPARSLVRLFYDGENRASYNVADSDGFAFGSAAPLVVGWDDPESRPQPDVVPAIPAGARQIQELVDAFGDLGVGPVEPDELVHLMADPRRLFDEKAERAGGEGRAPDPATWERVERLEKGLMANPYTVHQALEFMKAAPAMKVYALVDGEVVVNRTAARTYSRRERLHPPEVDVDELTLWDRALSPEEVLASYARRFKPAVDALEPRVHSLTVGVWNIWHGGKHFTVDEHGWDSRVAVAEILKREGVDVVLMQETYSSGDFIAAELGYTLATTVDWDYLNQGSNISVLSRFPTREVHVQGDSAFMNVAAKLALSETQELYAMSNWYGMRQFPAVFDFHGARFGESDTVPTMFGGDFNAVPHTDGGDSPASRALLEAGFTDAFRSLHPDVDAHPGPTHRSGRRIDHLYYKGAALKNTSTRLVSTWPTGFPSDHYLIVSTFELDDPTPEARSRPAP